MSTRYCIILTSYSRAGTGSKIIKALFDKRQAACIQVLPIRSFYTWKGKLARDRENLMLIKARSKDFGRIEATILENHDYELPEVVAMRIDRGYARYLRWLGATTK
jgi:periplasmic divalent cation tolerance protein